MTVVDDGQVTESFITRIWLERAHNGDSVWRGHIRHVQGPEQKYFEQVREMLDFIQTVTGVSCSGMVKDRRDELDTG